MGELREFLEILPLILPLLLIDMGTRVYAVIDILKPDRKVTLNNNKVAWIIIAALVNIAGIIYLLVGRDE